MRFDSRMTIRAAAVLLLCGTGALAGTYDLSWTTLDGGGGTSTGGQLELSATIAQPDASVPMTGGMYELTCGFWVAGAPAGDCTTHHWDFDNDGDVDLGDFSQFSLCYAGANLSPAGSCPPGIDADCDDDGDVDLGDFSSFSLAFTGPL